MKKTCRIQLLGGLRAIVDGETVTSFETKQTALLLARLSLPIGRAWSREELVELIWPEEDPELSRPRLRQALATLRQKLRSSEGDANAYIQADRVTVQLNSKNVSTDVMGFEQHIHDAKKTDTPNRRIELRRAVDLYAGHLLQGFYEDWILAERDRLKEEFTRALLSLEQLHEDIGDIPDAIFYARRGKDVDPNREDFYRALMRLFKKEGRIGDGIRTYEELERMLRKDLDVSPSEESRKLYDKLRTPHTKEVSSKAEHAPSQPDVAPKERESGPADGRHDHLTGTFNRRFLDEHLERLGSNLGSGGPLTVLMLDVDHFKEFNDRYGHQAGDALLQSFASAVGLCLRKSDYLARYGGEEFTAVLPGADLEMGRDTADRIIQTVRNIRVEVPNEDSGRGITVSIGIATAPGDGNNAKDLIKAADDALYRAKQEGRNRAVYASEPSQFWKKQWVHRLVVGLGVFAACGIFVMWMTHGEREKPDQVEISPAEQSYRTGRDHWKRRTKQGLNRSLDWFKRAAEEDPRFDLAYVGMSDAYTMLAYYGYQYPPKAYEEAEKSLQRVGSDGRSSAEYFAARGWVKLNYKRDWKGAEEDFRRAAAIDETYPPARHWLSTLHMALRRTQESLEGIDGAVQIDPLYKIAWNSRGRRYYHARNYPKAIALFEEQITHGAGDFPLNSYWLGRAYLAYGLVQQEAGLHRESQELFSKAVSRSQLAIDLAEPDPPPEFRSGLISALVADGKKPEAMKHMELLLAREKRVYTSPLALASAYLSLGQARIAFTYLEKAVLEYADDIILLEVDQRFDQFKGTPEFKFTKLLEKLNLPR